MNEKKTKNTIWTLILIIILGVSVYNGFKLFKERREKKRLIEQRKKELALLRQKEEAKRQLKEEQRRAQIERDRLERKKIVREEATRRKSPPPTPKPRSTVNHRYEVQKICEKCRCSLLQYNEQGHAIYIEVAGPTHSSVSDILPPLIRAGVVNFSEHKEKFGAKMINGKRMYHAAYTLRW